MKPLIIRFFSFVAILFIVDNLINGFEIIGMGSYLFFALLLSITYTVFIPLIKFFTLPVNMLTLGLFNFIIGCVYIYFFKLIIPGFIVQDGSIGPIFNDNIEVEAIKLSFLSIIIVSSLFITLLNNIITWAIDNKNR